MPGIKIPSDCLREHLDGVSFGRDRQRHELFFFQAEAGIRSFHVTGVQTCALPICPNPTEAELPHLADNHAFDVVSEINHAEMHNAVVQAQHEIAVRYDFKGTKASIEFNKTDKTLTLLADHKGQLETVIQVLKEKMAKRKVPVNALIRGKLEEASHDSVRETLSLHSGIDSDDARKIVKDIK